MHCNVVAQTNPALVITIKIILLHFRSRNKLACAGVGSDHDYTSFLWLTTMLAFTATRQLGWTEFLTDGGRRIYGAHLVRGCKYEASVVDKKTYVTVYYARPLSASPTPPVPMREHMYARIRKRVTAKAHELSSAFVPQSDLLHLAYELLQHDTDYMQEALTAGWLIRRAPGEYALKEMVSAPVFYPPARQLRTVGRALPKSIALGFIQDSDRCVDEHGRAHNFTFHQDGTVTVSSRRLRTSDFLTKYRRLQHYEDVFLLSSADIIVFADRPDPLHIRKALSLTKRVFQVRKSE